MKIILETNPELGLKISGDPKISYMVAFGMLKLAMEHLSSNYRCQLIDTNNKQAKKLKAKKPSREKKEH